ncbi:MAG: hypothetical protein ISR69_12615 [Gammaproteobacteria bacterium]|nr:hypothetical protein [Gammaproteobacteria bacterium]
MQHSFVIPGLYHLSATDLEKLDDQNLPYVKKYFQSARIQKTEAQQFDEIIAHYLEIKQATPPYVSKFSNIRNSLIATPILLKSDINSTWIQPANRVQEIDLIMQDMGKFFADDLSIKCQFKGHYIIQFKALSAVEHLPFYLTVLGRKIENFQSSIRENMEWFKLLNEIQMFLHGHDLNKTSQGVQGFNSLWLWGGQSQVEISHNVAIECDDELLKNALCGTDVLKGNAKKLWVKTNLLRYLKLNTSMDIVEFFEQLDNALSGCDFNNTCIETCDGEKLTYSKFAKYKFWAKKQNLSNLLHREY